MSRNVVLIAVVLLSLISTTSAVVMPTNTVTILPEECRMLTGEEMQLSLDGFIPPNTIVNWHVTEGGITSVLPGWSAVLIAPSEPAVITISVSISSVRPEMETSITRQCIVTSVNGAPNGLVQATEMVISSKTGLSLPID